jgi:hypothetical protein
MGEPLVTEMLHDTSVLRVRTQPKDSADELAILCVSDLDTWPHLTAVYFSRVRAGVRHILPIVQRFINTSTTAQPTLSPWYNFALLQLLCHIASAIFTEVLHTTSAGVPEACHLILVRMRVV